MKKIVPFSFALLFAAMGFILLVSGLGCANIIPPGGGPRDTLAPVLIAETPKDSATNISTNKITFTFNEFVEIQNAQENVLVSPLPNNTPLVDYRLRTVTVKLRDTLEPNTTYSINFGNAIKDLNEGNVLKNFFYVFSTGNKIDTFSLSGKVLLAETGKADSTLIVLLHRNTNDSAVAKEKPRYIAKLDANGNYVFRNLPAGTFALYALPNDYGKKYDDKTKLFAFADKPVIIGDSTSSINLFAYAEVDKDSVKRPAAVIKPKLKKEKTLKFTTNLEGNTLDILSDLELSFTNKIVAFDSSKLALTNKDYTPLKNYTIVADTSGTKFTIKYNWPVGTPFNLLLAKDAFADSAGLTLARADTIKFSTRKAEEYGSVKIRVNNIDTSKHPVLLLVQNDAVVQSVPLIQRDWSQKFFRPGEYELRVLYDANKNGRWDAGEFFGKHRQPEIVRHLDTKLSVRANWDNEKEITL